MKLKRYYQLTGTTCLYTEKPTEAEVKADLLELYISPETTIYTIDCETYTIKHKGATTQHHVQKVDTTQRIERGSLLVLCNVFGIVIRQMHIPAHVAMDMDYHWTILENAKQHRMWTYPAVDTKQGKQEQVEVTEEEREELEGL